MPDCPWSSQLVVVMCSRAGSEREQLLLSEISEIPEFKHTPPDHFCPSGGRAHLPYNHMYLYQSSGESGVH